MIYLIKNKTLMKFIFLCFFFALLFLPLKVHAISIKTSYYEQNINDNSFSGYYDAGNETWIGADFTSTIDISSYATNYDYVFFRLRELNFVNFGAENLTSGYTTTCTRFVEQWSSAENSTVYQCSSTVTSNLSDQEYPPLDTTVTAYIQDDRNYGMTCFFTSDVKDHLMCPLDTNFDFHYDKVKGVVFIFNSSIGGYSSLKRVNYSFRIDKQLFFGNNDSTDIVNGLTGVTLAQHNTTTAIQQQTQQQAQQNAYVQSSNISQAQSNTTQSITVLNDNLTQQLSQFSDLTQLVVAPITMFMELNNNVCAPLTLQIPFVNQTAVLPCIKPIMTQYFGGMYSVFTTVIGAILCYWTFVRTVALIKDLVDADNDKIEVVDL